MKKIAVIAWLLACIVSNAGELFVSKKYGFFVQFPSKPEATTIKSGMGENLAVASAVATEEPIKVLFYQIIVGDVAGMKEMAEFPRAESIKLARKNLETFLSEGKCTNVKISESKISSWPAVEFSCSQDGLFREGITSHKRGFAFLMKDTYYKIMVSSLEDNKELRDETVKFFAGFSFAESETLEQMEANIKASEEHALE